MNALTNIDTNVIADTDGEITLEQAQAAEVGADRPDQQLTRLRDRALVGRFAATQLSGTIVERGEWTQSLLERTLDILAKDAVNPKASAYERARSANAMKDLVNASANLAGIQLKAAEIIGIGRIKTKRKSNAPQVITGTFVNAENVQIVQDGPSQANSVVPAT